MNCAGARECFPELVSGPADAAVLDHIAACRDCAAESRVFRAVLEAAADYASADVPDPGDTYWEQFLPSVRARLIRSEATKRSRPWPRTQASAAAVLLVCLAVGALFLPRPAIIPDRPDQEAGTRLERIFLERPGLAPEIAADMLGVDPVLTLDASRVLTLIDGTDQTIGLAEDWPDDEIWTIIDGLNREQTTRLMAELSAERG